MIISVLVSSCNHMQIKLKVCFTSSYFTTGINTLRPRQNGRHFADNIFNCIFSNENLWISINISLKFVPKGQINNIPALFQIMAWHRLGDKPLSEPKMVNLLMHICVTRPQWVNSLRPDEAICCHRTWPTLAQVMACCLKASRLFLNQH